MNDTIELCREISDSADIGKLVLARLIRSSRDASFRSVMADMFAGYHAILTEAKQIISAFDAADGGARGHWLSVFPEPGEHEGERAQRKLHGRRAPAHDA